MLDLTQFEGHENNGDAFLRLIDHAPELLAEVKRLRYAMIQLRNKVFLSRINYDEIVEIIDEALK